MIRLLPFLLFSLFLGCSNLNYSEKNLIGTWRAVMLIDDKDTVGYDISQVQLQFDADKQYRFQGNLKNREAGSYYLLGKILYTTDTLVLPKTEKAVEIIKLDQDSMQLLMNAEGKNADIEDGQGRNANKLIRNFLFPLVPFPVLVFP